MKESVGNSFFVLFLKLRKLKPQYLNNLYGCEEEIIMTDEIMQFVKDYVNGETWGIWFLLGAALVFWMQAGFAMVETGFTRAKNAGNIIMKNLMDFCIGTPMFIHYRFWYYSLVKTLLVLLVNLDLIFLQTMQILTGPTSYLTLVFCATTATIVSGAMAERTQIPYPTVFIQQ